MAPSPAGSSSPPFDPPPAPSTSDHVPRRTPSTPLPQVIMLQEKVANVAHGWLLKEEGGVGGTQLKHFWFVLFSNGILMHFSDPNRANLGQSLGFIPVEVCVESSHVSAGENSLFACLLQPHFRIPSWLISRRSNTHCISNAPSTSGCSQPTQKRTCCSGQPHFTVPLRIATTKLFST